MSRATLTRKLEMIPSELLIKTKRGKVNYFSLDIEKLEQTI